MLLLGLGLPLALSAMARPARAADPLGEGRRALKEGRYAEAGPLLTDALVGPTRAEALPLLAELALITGRTDDALQLAGQAEEVPGLEAPAAMLRARALQAVGRYEEALAALRQATKLDPELRRARLELGELLLYLGRKQEARPLLERLVALDDRRAHSSAGDLTTLGRAALLLGKVKVGFDALDQATVQDPSCIEAHLHIGWTSLAKEDIRHAEEGFGAVLALNPHHPDALVGLGRTVLLAENDYDEVERLLGRALQTDPGHPGALRLKAELALGDEDTAGARTALAPLLERNPSDLKALALLAAACELDDDAAGRAAVEARVRRINPSYAELWVVVSRAAERAHRYPEAAALAQRALRLDPDYWPALRLLGVNLTRLGREDEGRRLLEQYYEHDDYNVPVVNTLNLYERFLRDYRVVEQRPFRLRSQRQEAILLDLFVLPQLESSFARFRKSYGFTPQGPLAVELFHDPALFGVRSVGLPAVASHGISFGRLITARSPSSNDFNWAQVLDHELSHVFGLQLSRYRVPRWLTEGLAEYETNVAHAEWARHHQQELYHALRGGRLPGIAELNRSFTHSRRLGDVMVAYHEASLLVRFLCEQWGYDEVVRLHRTLARNRDVAAALRVMTGLTLAQLDGRFRAWLAPRLAHLEGGFSLDEAAYLDGEPLEQAVRRSPDDAAALAALAAHLLVRPPPARPDPVEAYALARRALALAPGMPQALYLAGRAAMSLERPAEAQRYLRELQQGGHDGPDVARRLGRLALAAGDAAEALRQLRAAHRLDPDDIRTARLLLQAAEQSGDAVAADEALSALCLLDQNDPRPPLALAQIRLRQGEPKKAARYGQMALRAGLFLPGVHALLARIHLAQAQAEPALQHAFAATWLAGRAKQGGGAAGASSRPAAGEPPAAAGPELATEGDPAAALERVVTKLKEQGKLAAAAKPLLQKLARHAGDPGVDGAVKLLRGR